MRLRFDADPAFRCIVLRYMQALLNAASQTATCYRHHGIEQQVARVLLAIHDRLDGVLLPLTHQVIAGMLGVRREGVTEATNALRRDGLIEYARGRIHLLDLRGLSDRACECYAQIRDEYRRMSGER
jgi:CRP-like cAMP-binding protein